MTGKTEKAIRRLCAVNDAIGKMKDILEGMNEALVPIITKIDTGHKMKYETKLLSNKKIAKRKCTIEILPKRIEFEFNHLKFYIDFTLATQDNNASVDIKGCMIYGVNRSTCFAECVFFKRAEAKCKCCDRVSRCDGLEDKPLIQFFIDRQGMIQSAGEFEDSWWLDKEDDLPELHFRTMELIWPKALEWTNENLLG